MVVSEGPSRSPCRTSSEQPVDQAKAAVERLPGSSRQVTEKYDENVPDGTVISQSPEGGTPPARAPS